MNSNGGVWVLLRITPHFLSSWSDPFPEIVSAYTEVDDAISFVQGESKAPVTEWSSNQAGTLWVSIPQEPDFIKYQIHNVPLFEGHSYG